ncbi:MAG: ComF family protein [Herminiimonas sp.]|nr:ComF family protein [Herminiimonas sp.]
MSVNVGNLEPGDATTAQTTPASTLSWRRLLARAGGCLPGACALCGRTGQFALCPECRAHHFGGARRRCRCCALPLTSTTTGDAPCGQCMRTPPAFDATFVATDYVAPADQLVLELKFGGRLALAPLFAGLLDEAIMLSLSTRAGGAPRPALPDCLIAVPLGPLRLQQRGFNQALEIARPLAASRAMVLAPRMLIRTRDTAAQAQLSPGERRQNLRGAFTLAPAFVSQVRGRHIGVVDDVMTTGSTLHEIAATLKRFGAARVTNLVFARTLPG